MGSIFSKPKKPEPVPLTTYRDEIAGVEQVPVRSADGSIQYITRKIPKTPEEQKREEELNALVQQSLDEIKALSSVDYILDATSQELVDDVQEEKQKNLDKTFYKRAESEEEALAKRGLSDSTAGNTVRRQREKDEYLASKNLEKEKSLLENELRNQKLSNQYNLYNLAKSEKTADAAYLQNSLNRGLNTINSINSSNYASINEYYKMQANSLANTQGMVNNLFGTTSGMINTFMQNQAGGQKTN